MGGAVVRHCRATRSPGRQGEESASVAPPISSLRLRGKGTGLVAPPFAAAALTGRQAAGAREPTTPWERKERVARCRLCRHRAARVEDNEGVACAAGARRACRPRHLSLPPCRKAAGAREPPALPELGERVGCAAVAATELHCSCQEERGICPCCRRKKSAPIVPTVAAAMPPRHHATRARKSTALPELEERVDGAARCPRRGERGSRLCCLSEKSVRGRATWEMLV